MFVLTTHTYCPTLFSSTTLRALPVCGLRSFTRLQWWVLRVPVLLPHLYTRTHAVYGSVSLPLPAPATTLPYAASATTTTHGYAHTPLTCHIPGRCLPRCALLLRRLWWTRRYTHATLTAHTYATVLPAACTTLLLLHTCAHHTHHLPSFLPSCYTRRFTFYPATYCCLAATHTHAYTLRAVLPGVPTTTTTYYAHIPPHAAFNIIALPCLTTTLPTYPRFGWTVYGSSGSLVG